MADAASNAELQAFFDLQVEVWLAILAVFDTRQETTFSVIAKWTTQGISYLIRESSNTRHLWNIRLHAQLFVG